MKYYFNRFAKFVLLVCVTAIMVTSCNKDVEQLSVTPVVAPAGNTLGQTLSSTADDSLYYRLIIKAGMVNTINNIPASTLTMFIPGNNAMKALINALSGGAVPLNAPDAVFSGFITANIPAASAAAIVQYNIIPQAVKTANIPSTFPNWQYPSLFNPAPSVSALLRLTTFPSVTNGAWINNVPLVSTNSEVANGVIHHTAAVVTPPQRFLWDRINGDAGLTYLKAAIQRADSGTSAGSGLNPNNLQSVLSNIGPNLTVFAPTDAAFKATLTGAIAQALIAQGVPPATALAQATFLASTPAVFSNPALYSVLTAQVVKGIIVYHVLGSRAFTNNFSATLTAYPTLLNGAIPAHPGISIAATLGAPFVTAVTVKGLGNAAPANIIINASPLLPDPVGSSDQHYINGVLHKIDQVLLPQ